MSNCKPSMQQLLAGRLAPLGWQGAPTGTSHVLWHLPAPLPGVPCTWDAACWDLQPARDFLAGQSLETAPRLDGGSSAPEAELAAFAARELGHPVVLTRVGRIQGRELAEPAFWVGRQR